MTNLMRWGGVLCGLWFWTSGCATLDTRLTGEQLTQARSAVEAAEKADAKTFSPEHLRQAQDALAIAHDAYSHQEFQRAFEFAKKASIYARLALAQTEQKRAEDRLRLAQQQLEAARQQAEAAARSRPDVAPGGESLPDAPASGGAGTEPEPVSPPAASGSEGATAPSAAEP